RPGPRSPRRSGSVAAAGSAGLLLALLAAPVGAEEVGPRGHVWILFEQGPALPLGHPAPHPELDTVVECVGQAFVHHRAVPADRGGLALRGAADEQLVRVGAPTRRLRDPLHPLFAGIHREGLETRLPRARHPPTARRIPDRCRHPPTSSRIVAPPRAPPAPGVNHSSAVRATRPTICYLNHTPST